TLCGARPRVSSKEKIPAGAWAKSPSQNGDWLRVIEVPVPILGWTLSVHSLEHAVVVRAGAPHEPAVVGSVAGFQAEQAAGLRRNVDAAGCHGGLEEDRLADADGPDLVAGPGREAADFAVERADEELAVGDGRRRQHAVEQLLAGRALA